MPANFAATRAEIDVGCAHLAIDFGSRNAECKQPVRVQENADFAFDAAVAFDTANALQRLQPAFDDVVNMPRQLFQRHARAGRCVRKNRLALDVDALNDGFVDVARQVGADFFNGVFNVVEGAIGIDLKPEFNGRCRAAIGQRRDDVFDACDVGDRVFNFLRDLAFEFGRCGAALRHRHRDNRHVDVGKLRDRQSHETHDAENA